MPAYQIQRVEPQEERFIAKPSKVKEELAEFSAGDGNPEHYGDGLSSAEAV